VIIPNSCLFTLSSAALSSDIDSHTSIEDVVGAVQFSSLTIDDQEPDHQLTDHEIYVC